MNHKLETLLRPEPRKTRGRGRGKGAGRQGKPKSPVKLFCETLPAQPHQVLQ